MNAKPSLVLLLAGCCAASLAFEREQATVLTPPPSAELQATDDVVEPFARAYREAGRPRIVLLCNRELDDVTRAAVHPPRGTQGATADAFPATPWSLSDAVRLRQSFVDELGRGGVQFVDRALAMRLTAASRHRDGGDAKLIETDALVAHADLMLEVLMVPDAEAPGGYAFEVRAKDLERGTEILSLYSRAILASGSPRQGRWVAGSQDYVFASPPIAGGALGAVLARDTMVALRTRLPNWSRTGASRPR